MQIFKKLKPPPGSSILFIVFVSFLIWFAFWRIYLYFLPPLFFTVDGNHVHHYAYGFIILSVLVVFLISQPISKKTRLRLAPLVGIALALAYDEFAMWIKLEDAYFDRLNYDTIGFLSLVFLNAIYFPGFWARWGRRLGKLLSIIIFGTPRFTWKTLKKLVKK